MNYFKSKTLIFGALLTLTSIVQMLLPYFPLAYAPQVGVFVGVAVIVLRFLTTVPLDEK